MKAIKFLFGIGASIFLASCSALTPGHETFRCQGTDKGGICAPVDYIYANKNQIVNGTFEKENNKNLNKNEEYSKDVVLIKKKIEEKDCALFGDKCYLGEEKIKVVKEEKIPLVSLPLPADDGIYKKRPFPVREEALIQRVLIFPYQTREGNLVEKHFIYVVVREGRWLSPSGEEIKANLEE